MMAVNDAGKSEESSRSVVTMTDGEYLSKVGKVLPTMVLTLVLPPTLSPR